MVILVVRTALHLHSDTKIISAIEHTTAANSSNITFFLLLHFALDLHQRAPIRSLGHTITSYNHCTLFIENDLPSPPQANDFQEAAPHPASSRLNSTSQGHMLAFGCIKSADSLNHSTSRTLYNCPSLTIIHHCQLLLQTSNLASNEPIFSFVSLINALY